MSDDNKLPEQQMITGQTHQVTKSADYRVIYVNHCRGQGTAVDIQVTCSQLTVSANNVQKIEEQATLIFSVSEAKAVRDILEHLIVQSEALYGSTPYGDAHRPTFVSAPKLSENP